MKREPHPSPATEPAGLRPYLFVGNAKDGKVRLEQVLDHLGEVVVDGGVDEFVFLLVLEREAVLVEKVVHGCRPGGTRQELHQKVVDEIVALSIRSAAGRARHVGRAALHSAPTHEQDRCSRKGKPSGKWSR